jgi:putative Holliday junction resolvase
MRIMAVDYGRVHVGIAITDPLGIIPQPYMTIRVNSRKKLIARLKSMIDDNDIGLVLVGNPISASGKETAMSREITGFIKQLERATAVKIMPWDERYTSMYAANILKEHGLKHKGECLDRVSASLILEDYLRSRNLTFA